MYVTNEENWRVVRGRHVWGVSDRYKRRIEEIREDDFLVFYVRLKRIAASSGPPRGPT